MSLHHLAGKTVTHLGTPCDVYLGRYDNGRLAIQLVERATSEPWAKATVNVPDEPLGPDEVFIKDYSENDGMLAAVVAAGLVLPPSRVIRQGYVSIPVVRLADDVIAAAKGVP